MIFPIIDRYKVYYYKGKEVVILHQDIFRKVYLQTIVSTGESHFPTANWWNFMLNAKYLYELNHSKYEDEYRNSLTYM